jgi:hypothetical protein
MTADLNDVTGIRGEAIVELCLTDFRNLERPLFRPGFLGDKWPAIDFYVELCDVRGKCPYFFAQAKTTRSILSKSSGGLKISGKKRDVERLLRLPGPTYTFGIHEPSQRIFVRSVHAGSPVKAIRRIPLRNELTRSKLKMSYDEVQAFWATHGRKPETSVFA